MKAKEIPPFAPRAIYSDIYPLDEFYAARGEQPGAINIIGPEKVPPPYHALLVHQSDMTSTLEKFHGEKLHIEVLDRHVRENEYYRQVLLVLDKSRKRVEFGAIKINLGIFPDDARDEILREIQPLGHILATFNIGFSSRPSAFLQISGDPFIESTLGTSAQPYLYGRRNSLLDAWGRPLAEIVEILPS